MTENNKRQIIGQPRGPAGGVGYEKGLNVVRGLVMEGFTDQDQDIITDMIMDGEPVKSEGGGEVIFF